MTLPHPNDGTAKINCICSRTFNDCLECSIIWDKMNYLKKKKILGGILNGSKLVVLHHCSRNTGASEFFNSFIIKLYWVTQFEKFTSIFLKVLCDLHMLETTPLIIPLVVSIGAVLVLFHAFSFVAQRCNFPQRVQVK